MIYTVEIGGIEGGDLRLATTDKMEAWRYARREFYRLFYDEQKIGEALKWGRNVKVSGRITNALPYLWTQWHT